MRRPLSMTSPDLLETPEARARRRRRIAEARADLAYFEARIALIGDPASPNQQAQLRAFKTLHKVIGQRLLQLQGQRG
jgi:hypothetical protein